MGPSPARATKMLCTMNLSDLSQLRPASQGPDRTGTQSLGRGIKLMRMIAARPEFGWRLSDLAAACNQDKATVHRMLACMLEQRLVEQRASDRHYLPGPLMYELGLALPVRGQFQRRAETALQAFARRMGGIAMLLLRSGNEYVCSARVGKPQLSGLMIHPGTRRPLFTSVGGVAILQTLPADEAREVLLENVTQEVARRGADRLEALQNMRERSDRHGFGLNLGDVVPGINSFAVPVRDSRGGAFAAVCLVGTPELYPGDHLADIHRELLVAAECLGEEALKLHV